jgi:hypothetical protein
VIVLLVVADSLRADAPGFAGGGARTPVLDRLAADGASFAHAFASGAWTIPSLLSMLTGVLGHRLGVCRWRHPFPARRPTLLTAFAAAGFEVACFHPYPRWGLLTVAGKGPVGDSQDPGAVAHALHGRRGQDRFVLLHHWWTHLPYLNLRLPRAKWQAACDFALTSLNRYPERIAATLEDSYRKSVGAFSEEILPRYLDAASAGGEDVLLVVTGDHGETWGQSLPPGERVKHVFDLHGRWIADETVAVPLVVHGTTADGAVPAGRVLQGFARGADLAPTLAELAGVPWPGPVPGCDGPGVIDRDETDRNVIGRSLAACVMHGASAPHADAPTVSSHNTHVPDCYPADGRQMWRTMALRTREAWFVWDGVDGTRTVTAVDGAAAPDAAAVDAVFARLESQWRDAVDPAPIVEDAVLDELRGDGAEVRKRLRGLNYLD